jgi:hypothetical protein
MVKVEKGIQNTIVIILKDPNLNIVEKEYAPLDLNILKENIMKGIKNFGQGKTLSTGFFPDNAFFKDELVQLCIRDHQLLF